METKTTYILKHLLFTGLLVFMLFPLIQQGLKLFEERGLEGAFSPAPNIQLSSSAWLSGEFQEKKDLYLNEHFGFRKTLVRLYNQIAFSLYNVSKANEEVVVGQSDVLYLDYYINAYYGKDYLGEETLQSKVNKLAVVKDSLESHGIDLMVFLAPGKGSYLPENIPSNWNDSIRTITNFQVFSEMLALANIDLLDAKTWFEHAKDTTTHPLYPKTGIHWSKYGEYLVLDTVINRIEATKGIRLPDLVFDSIGLSVTMRDTDDDIERSMNLLFDIPDEEMGYPSFHFEMDSNTVKPNVLTIGDSYYWGVYHYGLSKEVFDNSEFWYYFETIYPGDERESNKVKYVKLREELEKTDMVILWLTESNVYSFGFIEDAYDAYNQVSDVNAETERQLRIEFFIEKIEADPEWFAKVEKQAKENGITVQECLLENAEYMVAQESTE